MAYVRAYKSEKATFHITDEWPMTKLCKNKQKWVRMEGIWDQVTDHEQDTQLDNLSDCF